MQRIPSTQMMPKAFLNTNSIACTRQETFRIPEDAPDSSGLKWILPLGFRPVSTIVTAVPIAVLLIISVFTAVTLPVNIDVVQGYP